MNYDELHEHIYGKDFDGIQRRINSLDSLNKSAWEVLSMLNDRKGFDHWWNANDFDAESRNEIFEEIKNIIGRNCP